MLNGSDEAARMVLSALTRPPAGRARRSSSRSSRPATSGRAVFSYLLPRVDRKAMQPVYLGVVEALGTLGSEPAVDGRSATRCAGWWAPLQTRRLRAAAAGASAGSARRPR